MQTTASGARSRQELVQLLDAGVHADYFCFYGHRPERDGRVGAGCLSQWWPVRFTVDGVDYRSAEHFMMGGKALLFGDTEFFERIVRAPDPMAAKRLGRQVRGFDPGEWAAHRFDIVVRGNQAKFGQHPDLRDFLLGTDHRVLVEAAPRDRIWGVGLGISNERIGQPEHWRGLNLLGFALMEVRERLR